MPRVSWTKPKVSLFKGLPFCVFPVIWFLNCASFFCIPPKVDPFLLAVLFISSDLFIFMWRSGDSMGYDWLNFLDFFFPVFSWFWSIVKRKKKIWVALDSHGNWTIILSFLRRRLLPWLFWMGGVKQNQISIIASILLRLLLWTLSRR